jgi:hypothetical protein
MLADPLHARLLIVVTELMASIGSPDAVTDVLKPSQLKDMAVFMGDVEQADGRDSLPAWPASIGYLSGAKVLYGHDRKYLPLVLYYCKAVMAKVEHLALFYAEAHEIVAEEEGPSPEAIAKYSNVAACGGAYYVNQGKPTGSVKTNTLDWKQDDEFPDDVCNKKVVRRGRWVCVGKAPHVRNTTHSHSIFTPPSLEGFCFHEKGKHRHYGLHVPVRRDSRLSPDEAREYVFAIVARRFHPSCTLSASHCLFGTHVSFVGRRHVYAALKRFFVNEQGGADFARVYYDYACSLSEVGRSSRGRKGRGYSIHPLTLDYF